MTSHYGANTALHIPEFSTGRTETIGADRAMIGALFDIVSVTSNFRPARASGIGACATVPTRVFAAPQR